MVTCVAILVQVLTIAYTLYPPSTFLIAAVFLIGGNLLLLNRFLLISRHVTESTRLETGAKGVK